MKLLILPLPRIKTYNQGSPLADIDSEPTCTYTAGNIRSPAGPAGPNSPEGPAGPLFPECPAGPHSPQVQWTLFRPQVQWTLLPPQIPQVLLPPQVQWGLFSPDAPGDQQVQLVPAVQLATGPVGPFLVSRRTTSPCKLVSCFLAASDEVSKLVSCSSVASDEVCKLVSCFFATSDEACKPSNCWSIRWSTHHFGTVQVVEMPS